jgi:hypothetical protein
MVNRKIIVEFTITWEDYDDVAPELVLEDAGVGDCLITGVSYKVLSDTKTTTNGNSNVSPEA